MKKIKYTFLQSIPVLIFLASIPFLTISCEIKDNKGILRLDGSSISIDSLNLNIHKLIKEANVHGLGIAIYNDNKSIYQQAFGYKNISTTEPLSDTTNIYGASLSKSLFAVLAMKLVEDGIIDLDIPLESYLPKKIHEYQPQTRWHDNYSDLAVDTLYQKITARMCLAHTCGFPNWRWFEPDQKLRVKFEPGTHYSYSGEGLVFLQVVIEKILDKGLEEIVQEKLFKPLSMQRSSFKWQAEYENDFAFGHQANGAIYSKDKDNEPRSASTLETTLKDYSQFLEAVLQKKILKTGTWDEVFESQVRIRSIKQFGPLSEIDTTLYDDLSLSYGLGWGLLDTPNGPAAFKEGHGDGFQHYCILFPEASTGVLIMANSDNGESIFKELLEITIADSYTPWDWQGYIPYNAKTR